MADVSIPALPSERRVGTDVGFAVGIVAIVTMLILPVPTVLIDIGLAFSIALSALILMVSLWIQRPLDFSAFPTVLLIATILRLALNVATTRVILSHGGEGEHAAGYVVAGFSKFRDGRRFRHRPDHLRDPGHGEFRRYHQGRHAYRGSGRALHARRHSRQANGDRRGPVRRA